MKINANFPRIAFLFIVFITIIVYWFLPDDLSFESGFYSRFDQTDLGLPGDGKKHACDIWTGIKKF